MEHTTEQMDNVPTEQAPESHQPIVHRAHGNIPSKMPTRRMWFGLAVLVLLLLLAGAAWFFAASHKPYDENQGINRNEYQAIFLTNGQVYFGKLTDLNHPYVTIKDIYYLQVQQSDGSLQDASGNTSSNSQVSLAKLGNELHGPEDKMSIASDQVLFWENLKSDSKVVQAITKYQNQ